MKHPDGPWNRPCDIPPIPGDEHDPLPFRDEPPQDAGSPEFMVMHQVELMARLHHMAFGGLFPKDSPPPAQMMALRQILRKPGLSQRELADQLHIQRATATVMLQKMERAGFVDRRPDPVDQRISRIYPTDAAVRQVVDNEKLIDNYLRRCFSVLTEEQFAEFRNTLNLLNGSLRSIIMENPDPYEKE